MAIHSGRICPTGNLSSNLISVPVGVGKLLHGRGKAENLATLKGIVSVSIGASDMERTEKLYEIGEKHANNTLYTYLKTITFGIDLPVVIYQSQS